MKTRIAACVEYGGANYCGWQVQANGNSVQTHVERALSQVAAEPIRVVACGRTDRGVHALGQIIHFDTTANRAPHNWLRGVNTHLPNDIKLLWTRPVADSFHARFCAVERSYRYVILNRAVAPAHLHSKVTWHYPPLKLAPMQTAARALIGRHDFTAFRAAQCQAKSPIRELRKLQLARAGEFIWADFTADGFLYHMVRNIIGSLLAVGEGRANPEWLAELLAGRAREHSGVTAPPDGLYFVAAQYPAEFNLPPPPSPCRFW